MLKITTTFSHFSKVQSISARNGTFQPNEISIQQNKITQEFWNKLCHVHVSLAFYVCQTTKVPISILQVKDRQCAQNEFKVVST